MLRKFKINKLLFILFIPFLLFSCFLKKPKVNQNKKKIEKNVYNKTSERQKKLTLKDFINWDNSRKCEFYFLSGKLKVNYLNGKKFEGSFNIEYKNGSYSFSIYNKLGFKIYERKIKNNSFSLCINNSICINIFHDDLIGYINFKKLKKVKILGNTLFGLRNGKIVIANYPSWVEVRDLEKTIRYYYDKYGKVKKIEIKLKRIGKVTLDIKHLICL